MYVAQFLTSPSHQELSARQMLGTLDMEASQADARAKATGAVMEFALLFPYDGPDEIVARAVESEALQGTLAVIGEGSELLRRNAVFACILRRAGRLVDDETLVSLKLDNFIGEI